MKQLEKEIQEQGLEATFWPGIKDPILPCRGISRAHKSIVRWAMESGLPAVTIMEDDIQFFAPGAYKYYISSTPTDFDLYLGNVFSGTVSDQNTVVDFAGLTLYTISSRFYEKFLDAREINNLDREMKFLGGKYVVCNPMVCTQHGGFSDNTKKYVKDYGQYIEGRQTFKG